MSNHDIYMIRNRIKTWIKANDSVATMFIREMDCRRNWFMVEISKNREDEKAIGETA